VLAVAEALASGASLLNSAPTAGQHKERGKNNHSHEAE
jgi:hypothetical protein